MYGVCANYKSLVQLLLNEYREYIADDLMPSEDSNAPDALTLAMMSHEGRTLPCRSMPFHFLFPHSCRLCDGAIVDGS